VARKVGRVGATALVPVARSIRVSERPQYVFRGNQLAAVRLSQRKQQLRFRRCIELETLIGVARENGDQRAVRKGLALHDDVATHDLSRCDSHSNASLLLAGPLEA
jgi:hypothetical protein